MQSDTKDDNRPDSSPEGSGIMPQALEIAFYDRHRVNRKCPTTLYYYLLFLHDVISTFCVIKIFHDLNEYNSTNILKHASHRQNSFWLPNRNDA